MITRHPIKAHHFSRRSASAAPVARFDPTMPTQPIPSLLDSSPDARSWRSQPVSCSHMAQNGSQDISEEEEEFDDSPDRSRSCIFYRRSPSDQGTPQSHTSELFRGSASRLQNMSDPISGPDPRLFGPIQYNPLSYSEGYASQYYSPSAYGYYSGYPAYQYPTFAPYSAYSVTPTATSANSSATVKPGSFSQSYPIEGGYMPESTFPAYDGAYGRPYSVAPYRNFQLYPHYQNLHLATQTEGHVEHMPAQIGAAHDDTKKKHAGPSRKSKTSAKTDEEKRRDMKEAVLKKVEDEARVEPSAHQSTISSEERLTPPEYSRKSIPSSRQRTEEEEIRELRDAFRRRQEDYDAFPTWIKQQEAITDNGKRKEGLEAFVDVVLEKSELSGKRAASQGPPSEPSEAREKEPDDILSPQTPEKRMRNGQLSIIGSSKVDSTNPVDTRHKPKSMSTAAGRALKPPPGLPYPPSNALLPEPLSSGRPVMAVQARLEEANNWFHREDSRKGKPLQMKIEGVARDYSFSKDSEQDCIMAKQATLLLGGVIANLFDYLHERDMGLSDPDPFTKFRYVNSRYCDKANTGRRSYFEIDPLINRRAVQPRRAEKPEKKFILIRHRRPEL